MKTNTKVVTIKEDFIPVDTKSLDSKHRLNLGGEVAGFFSGRMKVDSFQIYVGKSGDVLLRPVAHVPSRELWLYQNSSALAKVKKGLQEAKDGKTRKVSDLGKFLSHL